MQNVWFYEHVLPLKDQLFRLALRMVQNREEAEDIVQDTLLKVWNRRSSWAMIDNMDAFCMTVCRNLALDHLKRQEHQSLSLDELTETTQRQGPTGNPVEEHLLQQDRIQWVHRMMNRLPEKQRTCMQLRDIEGLPYKEIAQIMGITEEQVKINIFRARKTIKERIKQQ